MTAQPHPGSHRDPDSRVWVDGDRVLRAVAPSGVDAMRALLGSELFRRAVADGRLLAAEEVPATSVPDDGAAMVVEHPRLDPWTVPAEWSFSMLRDAALLHLDLTRDAMAEGLFLKDATPTNITFRGPRPVFVDHGSFVRLGDGEGWRAYDQLLRTFVLPLMLQAHVGADLHALLRGSADGVAPEAAAALLRGRNRFRRDVVLHATLPALAHGRTGQGRGGLDGLDATGAALADGGTPRAALEAAVARTRRSVERLRWRSSDSAWSTYGPRTHYEPGALAAKERFVSEALGRRHRRLVLDVGANDGHFSLLAAAEADTVVAADRDHLTVDLLHRSLRTRRGGPGERIVPMVLDLLEPTPAGGWAGRARPSFAERVRPDALMALAVVHHLVISGAVPPAEVVAWMASFGCTTIVEVPTEDDPMVQRLMAAKPGGRWDRYALAAFGSAFAASFTVVHEQRLPGDTRVMFHLEPR